jgi:hypothetical protein
MASFLLLRILQVEASFQTLSESFYECEKVRASVARRRLLLCDGFRERAKSWRSKNPSTTDPWPALGKRC